MKWFALAPLRLYRRLISPMLPATCRYYPSCSAYAVRGQSRRTAPSRAVWLGDQATRPAAIPGPPAASTPYLMSFVGGPMVLPR